MWTRTRYIAALGPALLSLALVPTKASGQEASPSAGELLACFEVEQSSTPKKCGPPGLRAEAVVFDPSRFDRDLVQAILDGFSHLAISSDDQGVRIAAAIWMTIPGDRDRPPEERVDGVVDLVIRTYSQSDDPAVRRTLANRVWRQADTEAAIAFLTSVATANPPEERDAEWPTPYMAVRGLLHMGPQGHAVLRRLHAEGAVRNGFARGHLQLLVDNGFQDVRPPR